jgi:hypothetical protein
MIINKQLFRQEPNYDFLIKLLNCFNISDIDNSQSFCKYDLQNNKTVEKIKELIPELTLYYIPCKSITYLSEIDEKRSITILKHFLLIFGYILNRKEIIKKNKKIIYYNIVNDSNSKLKILFENNKKIINFD